MVFWVFIALLTAAAILAVLLPLGRSRMRDDSAGHARQVYIDQLNELDRDKEQGRISASEAEAARTEVARRLIATDEAHGGEPAPTGPGARRATAVAALVGIPILSLSLYLALGAPSLPDAPLAARVQEAHAGSDVQSLVARVEAHLAQSPQDGRGWEVIAPVYLRLGRPQDAIHAYRNAIRILGSTADRQTALGEAILTTQNGIVTAEAQAAFAAANALDPQAPGPRFFLGLAQEQEGKAEEAAKLWQALLADTPADAPWRGSVIAALQRVAPDAEPAPPQPGPTADQVAAAQDMAPADRMAMIEGMVSGLAERLKDEPDDVEGWIRLIRSYVVLGRGDAAAQAATSALAGVQDASERARVETLIADLGLVPAEGETQ